MRARDSPKRRCECESCSSTRITTASMTAEMVAAAERVVPDAEFVGTTAASGVAALDGFRDDVLGAAAVVKEISANEGSFDAAILGCFAEPGLFAARELTRAPVVGIGEADFLTAMILGRRFSRAHYSRPRRPANEKTRSDCTASSPDVHRFGPRA